MFLTSGLTLPTPTGGSAPSPAAATTATRSPGGPTRKARPHPGRPRPPGKVKERSVGEEVKGHSPSKVVANPRFFTASRRLFFPGFRSSFFRDLFT